MAKNNVSGVIGPMLLLQCVSQLVHRDSFTNREQVRAYEQNKPDVLILLELRKRNRNLVRIQMLDIVGGNSINRIALHQFHISHTSDNIWINPASISNRSSFHSLSAKGVVSFFFGPQPTCRKVGNFESLEFMIVQ